MIGIPVYSPAASDFSTNGMGLMLPKSCTIHGKANGEYELTMVQPIVNDYRWAQAVAGTILKAPAPVRESPLYELTAISGGAATVTRKIYQVKTNGGRLHLRQKPSTSAKILGKYKIGTEVVQLEDNGAGWYRVTVSSGGATGWMYASYLQYVRDETETLTSNKPVTQNAVKVQPARDQLFRVYSVENDTARGLQTTKAMHIFYDLRGNLVNDDYKPNKVAAVVAAQHIWDSALNAHDFELHVGPIEGTITGEYGYYGIAEALLVPDEGIVAQSGCLMVRDNYDVFLLPDQARDMGVTIRRGKNLVGVTVTTDDANVVTRIIPRGKDKDGNPLYLSGTKYVDSAHIDDYPTIRAKMIDYDVQVSDADDAEFKTVSAARTELKRLAEAEFAAGIDLPTYGMEVDFVLLANTAEYANYAGLQSVHLYDTVTVIDEMIGLKAKVRVTEYTWNVLTQQYDSITLGEIQSLQQTTYGYTIADGTVSGSKIIPGSVDGSVALRDLSIQYAKIAIAAVEQLNAEAVNAITGRFSEIAAGSITTDELYAALAEIITLRVKQINAEAISTDELYAALADVILLRAQQIDADSIETDELAAAYANITKLLVENINAESIQADTLGAALAEFVSLYAATGEFDFATIQNLVSRALSLEQGAMDTVYIRNLAVTSANLLSATLGKLVIKGDDGKYYRVFVGSDGVISTEEAELTEEEISSGATGSGNQIVETAMNVGSLNATSLQASSAVINSILTTALSAEKITAADAMIASATIPALYATTIKAIGDSLDLSANKSISLLVGGKNANWRQEEPPENANINDLWIQPSTGYTYQAVAEAEGLPAFYIDGDGNLAYAYAEGESGPAYVLNEDGDLLISEDAENAVTLSEKGEILMWVRVKDGDLAAAELKLTPDGIIGVVSGTQEWQSIEGLPDAVDTQIAAMQSEVTQRMDGFDIELVKKLDGDELRTYMRYEDGIVEIGRSDSRYTTQTSDAGFVVMQDGAEMASMTKNTVSAPVIEARRQFVLGGYAIRIGADGGLLFT